MYNSFNNHGSIGLINTPSARFYDEGSFGITIYDGTPDQKVTLTSSPYSWLEASFFYTNIQGMPYPGYEYQDYKDKGLVIVGVPSNSFMQEYSNEEKVKDFCETRFNITFPLTKITAVRGENKHNFYKWLLDDYGIKPKWNFYKINISPLSCYRTYY